MSTTSHIYTEATGEYSVRQVIQISATEDEQSRSI